MRIVNLIENTEGKSGCVFEHGLSLYIETKKHKLLIDTGATEAFTGNSRKLGVDLKQVDLLILSHGHYDHSGGILSFAKINPDAKIIMQETAKEDYYHKNDNMEKYIGIDKRICKLPQVEYITGDKEIDEEIFIFSKVTGMRLSPKGNTELKIKKDGNFYQDDFNHEQYAVIKEGNRSILVSGCAHNGILNILDRYKEIYGDVPYAVISGFHMKKKCEYTDEELEIVKETAMELIKTDTKFYTGHCTGEVPYKVMKEYMGKQLVYVHSGDEIVLD